MSLCPEASFRDSLTDQEFWEWVFHGLFGEDYDWEPDEDDYPELWVGQCARCGAGIYCEDYEQKAELLDQRVAFCDDCVDETREEEPVPWEVPADERYRLTAHHV